MEKALNYNWNVYKVFKNGNRAKAPLTSFESSEEDAQTHFEHIVKKAEAWMQDQISNLK